MPDLIVFDIGATVNIGGDIRGEVTAVCLRKGTIQYEVAWWSGRDRHCAWLEAAEVRLEVDGKRGIRTIGFQGSVSP